MPGKGYKPASPEVKEQARQLRLEGHTITSIAEALGSSVGAISTWCRGIAKPIRATESQKQGTKTRREGKDISEVPAITGRIPPEDATVAAINEAARAKAETEKVKAESERQAVLDDIEERKRQRAKLFDLEVKAKEAEVAERESRIKMIASPSPELQIQLETARSETLRLRDELTEARHTQQLAELQRGFSAQLDSLRQSLHPTGTTEMDILDRGLDKAESLVHRVGDGFISLFQSIREDNLLKAALNAGVSYDEYRAAIGEIALNTFKGEPRAEFYRLALKKENEGLTEAEAARFDELWKLKAKSETAAIAARAKITQKISQANVGRQSHSIRAAEGRELVPGEVPVVLSAESKVVRCQRCGATFDVDLQEAKQQAASGRKLYINCPNPKCNFLLEITDLIPELAKPIPECYIAGERGCSNYQAGQPTCEQCKFSPEEGKGKFLY